MWLRGAIKGYWAAAGVKGQVCGWEVWLGGPWPVCVCVGGGWLGSARAKCGGSRASAREVRPVQATEGPTFLLFSGLARYHMAWSALKLTTVASTLCHTGLASRSGTDCPNTSLKQDRVLPAPLAPLHSYKRQPCHVRMSMGHFSHSNTDTGWTGTQLLIG